MEEAGEKRADDGCSCVGECVPAGLMVSPSVLAWGFLHRLLGSKQLQPLCIHLHVRCCILRAIALHMHHQVLLPLRVSTCLPAFPCIQVINVSSPNTPGLRNLQGRRQLQALLQRVGGLVCCWCWAFRNADCWHSHCPVKGAQLRNGQQSTRHIFSVLAVLHCLPPSQRC